MKNTDAITIGRDPGLTLAITRAIARREARKARSAARMSRARALLFRLCGRPVIPNP